LARSVRVVATTYTAEPAKLFRNSPLPDELGLVAYTGPTLHFNSAPVRCWALATDANMAKLAIIIVLRTALFIVSSIELIVCCHY
jgi:hypothetical protein